MKIIRETILAAVAVVLASVANAAETPCAIALERIWQGRMVFEGELPFPDGVTFLPAAHYSAEIASLPAAMRIVDERGAVLAAFSAPDDIKPPYTMHLGFGGMAKVAVFTTKDGETRLSRLDTLPEGFDPRRVEYSKTLSVRPSGGAGSVRSALSAGVGQADVRFVSRGREGSPYIEDGRMFFTFSERFYGSACGVASMEVAHPERGVRFEGTILFDYGDGLLRNDLAPHLFYDEDAGEWRGWACNFSTGADSGTSGRAPGGVNAVWSKEPPLHGLCVMKAKPLGLSGMNEDPCGIWDGEVGRWRLLVSHFTPKGIRAQMLESERWDGGFVPIAGPISEDSTGTTIATCGGTRYCFSGSADRQYYVYSYPALEKIGTLKMTPTPWGEAKGWPHGRGWPAFVELPEGAPCRNILLTMDRVNFPGMPDPNWTYGSLSIYTQGSGAARWISGDTRLPEKPTPVLFREFALDAKPTNAVFKVAVAGWCEVYVNGEKVGRDVLSPVTCQPDKRLSSVAHDVAPFLKKGENVVEVLLGNGWFNCFTKDVWGFSSAPWLGAPKICGELVADGKVLLATDGSWTACDSPIVFNALRNGEYYDARREGSRANVRAVKVEDALSVSVSPEDAAPCRAFDPIPPVRSFPAGNGGIIYDFGSNRTGWCEIEVAGEAGSKVTIDYDECLTPTNTLLGDIGIFIRRNNDPHPAQHDEYTLAGKEGGERWHPRFTYHGFRYAQVRTEGKVELKSIKSVFVHSDFDSVGSFKISDLVFGKLQDATCRSYLSNFTGIPTDCPHREKNGWTGDAQLAMETGLWNFDARSGYVHFMRMMIDAQKPDGKVPCILPCTEKFGYGWGSGPAWDAILFEIPWRIFRFYGDDAPAKEAYPAMKRYLSFIGGKARSDGLVEHGLGDWCAPTGVKVAPVLLTDSAYVYEFYRRVMFWAERFGEGDFAAECRRKAAKVKAAFNKEFYKGGGVYAEGELTSLAAPLYFKGLCADGEERKVVGELLRRIRENGHKAKFGILGAKWIPRVLADYGYIDDAWRIFTQPDAPGWAVWMKDNDTLLESFDDTAGGTPVSHNHIMFGDLSAWAFEYLAGIKIDEPGFAKCHAEPYLPNGVDSFDFLHRTAHGLVRARAWREDGKPRYYVDIASDYIGFSKDSSREAAASGRTLKQAR